MRGAGCCRPRAPWEEAGSGVVGDDRPERPGFLVVRPGREEELIVCAVVGRVPAERDRPQAIDGEPLTGAVPQLTVLVPLGAVPPVRGDPAVAEVANEQVVAE